jgi:alpha-1,2-mannosyltransferase
MRTEAGSAASRAAWGSAWLVPSRVERWSWFFLGGYLVFFIGLLATAHGLNDFAGRPLGADFSSFYSAGTLARLGLSPYDQSLLHQTQQSLFGTATPYFGFAYPPPFLLLLTPLSLLPYPFALAAWQAGTLTLYVVAMMRLRRVLTPHLPPRPFLLASLGFTAVFVSLYCGQNGLLSAALMTFAFSYLGSRPIPAGLCIGLLAFKPQLAILIPFALAASGRWRVFFAAALVVLILSALCTALFGLDVWKEFVAAGAYSRSAILDQGRVGYYKMMSTFSALRLVGVPVAAAYGAQALSTLVALLATMLVWRKPSDHRLQYAILCVSVFFATPFALDYDMTILAPALALLAAYGMDRELGPLSTSSLALLWIIPMLSRAGGLLHMPIGLLVAACVGAMIWTHAWSSWHRERTLSARDPR